MVPTRSWANCSRISASDGAFMGEIITFYGEAFYAVYSETRRVSPEQLRQIFNEGEYWWRAEVEHEFELEYPYQEPASDAVNQPPGTVSQEVIYHIQRQFYVRVHQLLLPYDEYDDWGRPR